MRPGTSRCASPRCGATTTSSPVDNPDHRVSLGEGFTPLLARPQLGARSSACRACSSRTRPATRPGPSRPAASRCAVSMAKALRRDRRLPALGRQRGQRARGLRRRGGLKRARVRAHATSPRVFVMETEAYGADVETVDGLITRRGPASARERATRARLVRVRDAQGALPRRGQEDDGLRARRADGLDAARRDPLPDRRRHRASSACGRRSTSWRRMGFVGPRRPRMYAVQAEGCAPIVKAFAEGRTRRRSGRAPRRCAHGLRVPKALGRLPDPARPARRATAPASPSPRPRSSRASRTRPPPRGSSWRRRAARAWPRCASCKAVGPSERRRRAWSSSTPAPASSTSTTMAPLW